MFARGRVGSGGGPSLPLRISVGMDLNAYGKYVDPPPYQPLDPASTSAEWPPYCLLY